jgi:UrcA family protein
MRVARGDWNEESAGLDLFADRLIPHIAASQLFAVEPDLDAGGSERGLSTMDQLKRAVCAAATLLACALPVSSAFASESDAQVRTEDIMFQDLNLTTNAGIHALYNRIHSAALRVCAESPGQHELGAASDSATCSKKAETRAIEKLNLPALTAFAADR